MNEDQINARLYEIEEALKQLEDGSNEDLAGELESERDELNARLRSIDSEPDYDAPTKYEQAEMMHRIQRDLK
jgi:hypothetical protein